MKKKTIPSSRRVTLKQVAQAAGVSTSTVSRALNHHPGIPDTTRKKISEAADRLGYRPDPEFARLMASYRGSSPRRNTSTIAFVNCWPSSSRTGHPAEELKLYYEEAQDRADQFGYQLEEFWLGDESMTATRLEKILVTRGIKGVVIPPIPDIAPWINPFDWSWEPFSMCAIGYSLRSPALHRVSTHHYHDMWLAIRRCCELGYRKIGLALGPTHDSRVEHYWLAAFAAYQCFLEESCRVPILLTRGPHVNEEEFSNWYRKEQPEVVITPQRKTLAWLRKMNISIPDEAGIVLLAVTSTDLGYSGIRKNSDLIASSAVDRVIGQIHRGETGIPDHPITSLLDAGWVEGTTLRRVGMPQPCKGSLWIEKP